MLQLKVQEAMKKKDKLAREQEEVMILYSFFRRIRVTVTAVPYEYLTSEINNPTYINNV